MEKDDNDFDHLMDWVDAKEAQARSLKHGLLAFLNKIEGKTPKDSESSDGKACDD